MPGHHEAHPRRRANGQRQGAYSVHWHRTLRLCAMLAGLVTLASATGAYGQPPSSGSVDTGYALPLTSSSISGLTLLASNFEEVEAAFGTAKTRVTTPGLDTVFSLCYASTHQ